MVHSTLLQRISAIDDPGGDTYTPSSGIWQTVWLENVPEVFISNIKIQADTWSVKLFVWVNPEQTVSVSCVAVSNYVQLDVNATIIASGETVTSHSGTTGSVMDISISAPKLWSPDSPFLYDLSISVGDGVDEVSSYFGMRSFTLGLVKHPAVPDSGPQVGVDRSKYVPTILCIFNV